MMGFYVAVTLVAVLSTGNEKAGRDQMQVLVLVWGTTVGLAVAHWFAMILSARVVNDPHLHHTPGEMLYSQLVMAVGIALAATLVVIVVPNQFDRLSARLTAALFIAGMVGFETRAGGASHRRAILYGSSALLIGFAIASLKWFVSK